MSDRTSDSRLGFWGWFWIIAFGVLVGSILYLSCMGVG